MLARGFLLRTAAKLSKAKSTRYFATKPPPEVIIFPDPDMVVCWHPEQNFPYECSKPLPEVKPSPYSVLRIQEKEAKAIFARSKKPEEIAMELAKLTYTTKHRWFPRSRDKEAKKTKRDRPYL